MQQTIEITEEMAVAGARYLRHNYKPGCNADYIAMECFRIMLEARTAPRFPSVRGKLQQRIACVIADNPGIGCLAIFDKLEHHCDSLNLISVSVHRLKKLLPADGYTIESSCGRGGGYRMRRISSVSNAV